MYAIISVIMPCIVMWSNCRPFLKLDSAKTIFILIYEIAPRAENRLTAIQYIFLIKICAYST